MVRTDGIGTKCCLPELRRGHPYYQILEVDGIGAFSPARSHCLPYGNLRTHA